MKLSIVNQSGHLEVKMQRLVEQRIQQVLHRLSDCIEYVTLIITDENGPRGGVDKSCRVIVSLKGRGSVTTIGRHEHVMTAVDFALRRARSVTLKRINRRMTRSRKPTIRYGVLSDDLGVASIDGQVAVLNTRHLLDQDPLNSELFSPGAPSNE